MNPDVRTFFDESTSNATHLVRDPAGTACAVIDTVLDFDMASGRTGTTAADEVIAHIEGEGLNLQWILESHVHADHLTAAPYFKEKLGGNIGIGENVRMVQEVFGAVYNAGADFAHDGSQFDHLFRDGEEFSIGGLSGRVMMTPGHTPACAVYIIGDAVFTGDTLFMPDSGTARCDFPKGSAEQLYDSIQKILSLPDETRVFINHDYGAGGKRDCAWETTVAEEKKSNIHVGGGKSREEFVKMRTERDATLSMPRLILPSIQVNMRAGRMPPAEDDGHSYMKLPINRF